MSEATSRCGFKELFTPLPSSLLVFTPLPQYGMGAAGGLELPVEHHVHSVVGWKVVFQDA